MLHRRTRSRSAVKRLGRRQQSHGVLHGVVYLLCADKSEQPIRSRPSVVKQGNFSLTPESPHMVCSHFPACGGLCGPLPAGLATSAVLLAAPMAGATAGPETVAPRALSRHDRSSSQPWPVYEGATVWL